MLKPKSTQWKRLIGLLSNDMSHLKPEMGDEEHLRVGGDVVEPGSADSGLAVLQNRNERRLISNVFQTSEALFDGIYIIAKLLCQTPIKSEMNFPASTTMRSPQLQCFR